MKKGLTLTVFKKKIQEYFDICCNDECKGEKPYTISGLCLHLGISKEELKEYQGVKGFSQAVDMALLKIEEWIESKSLTGELSSSVAVLNLKNNFGWSDKKDNKTEHRAYNFTIKYI